MSKIGSKIISGLERMKIVRTQKNPPVKTTADTGDTFDSFHGVNLGIIKIGAFRDQAATEKSTQASDQAGAKKLQDHMKQLHVYRDVKVSPDVKHTDSTDRNELFRGIVLGNSWKIGRFTVKSSESRKTEYNMTAKLKTGIGYVDLKQTVSQTTPSTWKSRTWMGFEG